MIHFSTQATKIIQDYGKEIRVSSGRARGITLSGASQGSASQTDALQRSCQWNNTRLWSALTGRQPVNFRSLNTAWTSNSSGLSHDVPWENVPTRSVNFYLSRLTDKIHLLKSG